MTNFFKNFLQTNFTIIILCIIGLVFIFSSAVLFFNQGPDINAERENAFNAAMLKLPTKMKNFYKNYLTQRICSNDSRDNHGQIICTPEHEHEINLIIGNSLFLDFGDPNDPNNLYDQAYGTSAAKNDLNNNQLPPNFAFQYNVGNTLYYYMNALYWVSLSNQLLFTNQLLLQKPFEYNLIKQLTKAHANCVAINAAYNTKTHEIALAPFNAYWVTPPN